MNADMLTMLRTLIAHLDQHDLTDTVVAVDIRGGEFGLHACDREHGIAAALTRWADSLGEVDLTATPGSIGTEYMHVSMVGRIGDHKAAVRWVASGEDAAGLRRLLGIDQRPTFSLDLDALAGLDIAAAA